MTENEIKLIDIIRTQEATEEALMVAISVILEFLEQDESSQALPLVCSQESA